MGPASCKVAGMAASGAARGAMGVVGAGRASAAGPVGRSIPLFDGVGGAEPGPRGSRSYISTSGTHGVKNGSA